MCGIAGFTGKGTRETLTEMTRSLRYRGPDEEGYFVGGGISLGHRRLSIIDLSTGSQPIFNEDRTVAVVFNGEIYNFRALRKRLEGGHSFYTNTDTEILVHLYEEKGIRFVEDLEGMFAIALWDESKKMLVLARDRFGEKPLYYGEVNGALVFGSELKALLAHPEIRKARSLDTNALAKYFLYEYVPSPQTIFQGLFKLPAAHILTHMAGITSISRYFTVLENFGAEQSTNPAELDEKLDASVKKMLVADVPLGVWLSGGLDSSTVAYYTKKNSTQQIRTFSIGFKESSFDESKYAERAAEKLGTLHSKKIFAANELLAAIPTIYSKLDEPLADPSLLPTFLLAQFSRESVTVVLGGDGGDELFMGYPTFQAERLAQSYANIPRSIRAMIQRSAGKLPTSLRYMSLDFKLKKFTSFADYPFEIRNQLWIGAFSGQEIGKLLKNPIDEEMLFQDIRRELPALHSLDNFERLSYLYLTHYMQDDILVKSDRASMYNSLEVRAPFLDHILASFVFSLPRREKLRGFRTKHVLKKLMAPRIGSDLAYRKKQGFQPPIARWLKYELLPLMEQHLGEDRLEQQGLFNAAYVQKLVREHRDGKADHRKKLWSLLVFQLWNEQFNA